MFLNLLLKKSLQPVTPFLPLASRPFTGKTESGFKFKTPKMRMRVVRPIFPPPGLDLKIPEGLTHEQFCRQIGGDCAEYADKFENIEEMFKLDSKEMKAKGVPIV